MPRQTLDAECRNGQFGRSRSAPADVVSSATYRDNEEPAYKRLTAAEAAVFRQHHAVLSPWRVIAAQVGVGTVVALLAWALTGESVVALSALYGAAVVALPGALMARGATSRLSSVSPLVSTASMMAWGVVKMLVSLAMLAGAARVVPGLSWPVMLAALVVCMQTYWFALLWRGSR